MNYSASITAFTAFLTFPSLSDGLREEGIFQRSHLDIYGITVILNTLMRFEFDNQKSNKLKADHRRQIGFNEVQEIWSHPHYIDCRSDDPEQFRAIGWVKGRLFSVIYEVREDDEGEYYHLVTLWKSTKEEEKLYEEYS